MRKPVDGSQGCRPRAIFDVVSSLASVSQRLPSAGGKANAIRFCGGVYLGKNSQPPAESAGGWAERQKILPLCLRFFRASEALKNL